MELKHVVAGGLNLWCMGWVLLKRDVWWVELKHVVAGGLKDLWGGW